MFMSWPEKEKLDDACDEDQLASTEHWLHLAIVERLEATCLLQALLQVIVDHTHRFLKVIVPVTCEAISLAKIGHTKLEQLCR